MPIEFFDGKDIKKLSTSRKVRKNNSDLIQILRYVCSNIIKGQDYEALSSYLLKELSEILHASSACISCRAYHKNGKQYLKCIDTYYDQAVLDKPIKIKGSTVMSHLFGTSCLSNKCIVSNDLKTDQRFAPISSSSFKFDSDTNIKSFFSAPLYRSKNDAIGQISFFKVGEFDVDDIYLVLSVLDILGKLVAAWKKSDISSSQEIPRTVQEDYRLVKVGDRFANQKNDPKSMFLASISHEIRTPLNGIVGMITMLLDAGPLTDKQKEYLDILLQCSHQLMNLMNNILDFNKLSSGKLSILKNPLDIEKAIQDSINMVENKAIHKGLNIFVEKDKIFKKGFPIVLGDQQRLTQIISNLVSNAVKFTEKGSIKIKVGAAIQSDSMYNKRWRICFDVIDTGIGIPKSEQKDIFKAFQQASNNSTKVGTGLGLSIVKELVKLMHGKIRVKSSGIVGKGTTFSFCIIVEEEIVLTEIQNNHKTLLENTKVLIVDDRQEYRLQFTDMLYKWKCQPIALSSGEEALHYLKYNKPDIIIVDICMPYMSGIELAQELRKSYKDIPLIALSSIELKSGKELFDSYLNKPIDQNTLFPLLIKCLLKKLPASPSLSKETSERNLPSETKLRAKKLKKDIRILIAEDDVNNRYTLTEMLHYLGFTHIKCIDNGQKCVEEIRSKSTTSEMYDVVLMDIIMPIMDGIEATKHIRQLRYRPYIIITSAVVQNTDKEQCQQIGVDGYLTKPILKENLYTVLTPLLIDV